MNNRRIARTSFAAAFSAAATVATAQPVTSVGERPITRAEVAKFVGQQFADADADQDGSVSRQELQAFRTKLEARDKATFDELVAQSFDQADIDADGEIARWEVDQRAMQLFDLVDTNQDGIASIKEQTIAAAITNLQASDLEQLLGQIGPTRR